MTTFYRKGTKLQIEEYNFTCHQGGLGDLIAQLPAIKYVLNTQKQILINLWVHSYAVELCSVVFKDYLGINLRVKDLSNFKADYNDNLLARSPYAHKISNINCNIVDHAFLTLAGTQLQIGDPNKNYIKLEPQCEYELPKEYAVITTGFTSKTREWLPSIIDKVCLYLNSKNITPVFLGKTYTPSFVTENINQAIIGNFNADYSKGINLIDKTNLFQAHAIMSRAKMVLGLDNGLLHLAAMSDVPIIAGFSTVEPHHRTPQRNNIFGWNFYTVYPTREELRCIGCQSNMNFAKHQFTDCYYGDFACLSLLTEDKWIKQIERVLIQNG